ncbi:nucleotide-sugar transporter-domain-containing protein [Aspergillus pseudoustus]|uniref:Nucleotide-sugar transporter-domain-containing protein n=1 Tax=Aspergillus pseudoustus TaxID=1810923 RepID=A0ABR4K3W4_9EURO
MNIISQLQHKAQSRAATDGGYNPITGILLVEAAKLTISAISHLCVSRNSDGQVTAPNTLIMQRDAALPAIFFTMATILQSSGAYYLDLVPYLALSQLKVILAPLFARVILKHRYPVWSWLYVFLMALGIILSQLGTTRSEPSSPPERQLMMLHGVASMLLAGTFVALGSTCVEKAVKKNPGSLLAYNVQLAGYSLLFVLCYYSWLTQMSFAQFFRGFNTLVVVYLDLQVAGGLLVAWCVYMTSTVTKNYAQGLGFSLAVTVPLVQGHHRINIQVAAGVLLVLVAVLGSALSAGRASAAAEPSGREKVSDVEK